MWPGDTSKMVLGGTIPSRQKHSISTQMLACEAILKMESLNRDILWTSTCGVVGVGLGTCLVLFYRNCLDFQDFSTQQRENSIFSSNSNQEIILQKKKNDVCGGRGEQLKNSSLLHSPENTNRTEKPEESQLQPDNSHFWVRNNLGPDTMQIIQEETNLLGRVGT